MDDLLENLVNHSSKCTGFADDFSAISSGIDLSTTVNLAQNIINIAIKWGEKHSLQFSPQKSCAMIYTKKRLQNTPKLTISGTPIEFVQSTKYLGITIDNNLNFNEHITEKTKKAKRTLTMARRAVGPRWGINPKTTTWIHNAIIKPMITYGAVIWAHKITKTNAVHLEQVQRLACLLITGAMRTTPTKGMEIILNLISLDLFCQQEALQSWWRIQHKISRPNWDGITKYKNTYGHQRYWTSIMNSENLLLMPSDASKWLTRRVTISR